MRNRVGFNIGRPKFLVQFTKLEIARAYRGAFIGKREYNDNANLSTRVYRPRHSNKIKGPFPEQNFFK